MFMSLSDLQRKDMVSLVSGKKLGRIVDAKMDEKGLIEFFVVANKRLLFFWKNPEEMNVPITNMKKIGLDVILVDL